MIGSNKTTRRYILTARAAVLCAFLVPARVHAQAYQYSVTVLGSLTENRSSTAYGINASGQVAGNSYASGTDLVPSAVIWSGTTPTLLGYVSGGTPGLLTGNNAYGINASGQIAGYSTYDHTQTHNRGAAVVWNGTTPTVLTSLGGTGSNAVLSVAYAINTSGAISGYSRISDNTSFTRAVMWNGTTPTALGSLDGVTSSVAYAINDSMQVAGTSYNYDTGIQDAVRWNGTTPTTLTSLGGTLTYAYGINASGQVAGTSSTALGDSNAVIWNGTTPTTLATGSGAHAINASGQVIGNTILVGGVAPFLYTGGATYDLESLLVPGSGVTNLRISEFGNSINDSGQIAATGTFGGQTVALRLSPTSTLLPYALYWSGATNGTWSIANNWVTKFRNDTTPAVAAPTSLTDVIFSTAGAVNQTTTLTADMSIRSLTVDDINDVSIGGMNTLTILGDSAITVSSGAGLLTISSGLALTPTGGNSPTITVDGDEAVLISGAVSGTHGLTKAGTGTLTLTGTQTYDTLTTTEGTTNVDNAIGTGSSAVNANATTNFGVSQTLAALNIGAGAVVTLEESNAFGAIGGTIVPEPGSLALLLIGTLGLAVQRRVCWARFF